MTDPIALFSSSYPEARARFVEAASKHPHFVEGGALAIDAEHTIDWALTGDPDAEDLLVYTSGLHGIEGYAGGAVMLRLLGLGEPRAVLWMHALNPWGMDRFRRVNENNVDLNRNFLPDGASYAADDAAYAALDPLLNPKRPPGPDLFLVGAAYHLARHGMSSLRNAVARGQYSFPEGIFYGGRTREATTREVLGFLPAKVKGKRRVVHIDLHTARGPRGDYVAFLEGADPTAKQRAEPIFGSRLRAWTAGTADGYDMRGGMLPELQRRAPGVRYDAITLEFGTATDLAIVRALRAENQLHFHGGGRDGGDPDHPARRAMRNAFFPDDPRWRASVVSHAVPLHRQAERLLGSLTAS
ncbi:MAG: hypothetical protein OHK0013_44730 [Sandaracinaceae bacterium]